MRRPDPFDLDNAEPGTLLQFAAITLFIGSVLALLIVAATPIPA